MARAGISPAGRCEVRGAALRGAAARQNGQRATVAFNARRRIEGEVEVVRA